MWQTANEWFGKSHAELEQLEESVSARSLPLDAWKEREKVFQAQLDDPTVDRKKIKNPYEPDTGKGA